MMHNIVNGQYWQLVGPEAPDDGPGAGCRPKPNQVIAPGRATGSRASSRGCPSSSWSSS